jgi:hypothetical protein
MSSSSPTSLGGALLAIIGASVVAASALVLPAQTRGGSISRIVDNDGAWNARSTAWFVTRGIYPTEYAPNGAPHVWAAGRVRFTIPRLQRDGRYRLEARVRSGRASTDPPAAVRVAVDGLDVGAQAIGHEWQELVVTLPEAKRDGVVILLDAEKTFVPGGEGTRALAYMLERFTLTPIDAPAVPVPRVSLIDVALFGGAVALAVTLLALPSWMACAIGALAGGAAAWLTLRDSAFLGDYSTVFRTLGLVVVLAATASSLITSVLPAPSRAAWRGAVMLAMVVTALRLAVFLHPNAPVSDGMFHVHRAQEVRAGQYFFTSVTPRPFYEFPYPVGLYVAAAPMWDWFTNRVALLRGLTLVADAAVAVGLFAVVAARWSSAVTGVLATVLALTVPIVTQSVSTANLTNVFAQSCFSLAILWIAWHVPASRWLLAVAGTVVLLTFAWLSHFSTAVIGAPAAALVAASIALARDPRERGAWRWAALSVALALGLSYALYYSRFHDVYARTLSRVGHEKVETSLVATLAEHSESKILTMLRFLVSNYGWGLLALAAIGLVAAVRRDWRQAWTLILLSLTLTVGGFFLLGAFTPVEMRANLAAHPVFAAFGALGVSWLWRHTNLAFRTVAVAAVGWTLWAGLSALRAVLG